MSSQEIYAQVPLNTDRREIRILALASGTNDDALRGDLFVESLNYDDLHYTALSYTWSGLVTRSAMTISGIPLLITENLELALRRIRGPSRSKNLWVDAICINQNDSEEKSIQVSLMGDIYASATRTTVWLGEESAQSDVAMDFIHSLRDGIHTYDTKADQILTQAITELMGREWWTRVWVIQEALMSRRVILMCGDKEVDLVYFIQLIKDKEFRKAFSIEDGPKMPHRLTKRSFQNMTLKDKFKHPSLLSEQPFINLLTDWYAYKQQAETSGLNLMDLTLLTHGFRASVQRDKIFALLGLTTPEARSLIIPDYSDALPHRLLLIRITAYFLQFSWEPLRIALRCPAADCPSWVVDWTAIDDEVFKAVKDDGQGGFTDGKNGRLPYPKSQPARFKSQLEPPFQGLKRYQEPSALLIHGSTIHQIQVAVQIPSAHDVSGKCSKGAALSILAKIREWKSLVFQHIQRSHFSSGKSLRKIGSHWMVITDLRPEAALPDVELRALVMSHLVEVASGRSWYELITRLLEDGDRVRKSVINYEEWMLLADPDGRHFGKHHYFDVCLNCSKYELHRGLRKMGQKIIQSVAGKTLVLNNGGVHHDGMEFVTESAVNAGDLICSLRDVPPLFILRRAGDGYWKLVGHLRADDYNYEAWRYGLKHTTKELEVFRLK